jgi:F0F1-type ATP synthase membrane subunit b/b'
MEGVEGIMTQQEFDDLVEQLEAELEEARDLLRQGEEEGVKRVIDQAQNEISRIVHRMSSLKHDWDIEHG